MEFMNIINYYSKNFKIESFYSFFDNNERILKYLEDKEDLEKYLKLIIT